MSIEERQDDQQSLQKDPNESKGEKRPRGGQL